MPAPTTGRGFEIYDSDSFTASTASPALEASPVLRTSRVPAVDEQTAHPKLFSPPGSNPIAASLFDLYRDSREERPIDSIQYGPWAGGQFAAMAKRHMAFKKVHPDRPPTHGKPYTGIENLRPESKKAVEIFMLGLPQR